MLIERILGNIADFSVENRNVDKVYVEWYELEKKLLENFTGLAGIFGPDVCVEGIETSGMCDIIKEYGIHSFQGYYYSKPVPLDVFSQMLADNDFVIKQENE